MIVYDKYALKLAAGIAWKYRDEAAHPDQTFDLRVEDTSGAVLVGAKVTMKNTGTGISSVTMSNSAGLCNFTLVQVGNYDLTVESEGFKSETIRNMRVETGVSGPAELQAGGGRSGREGGSPGYVARHNTFSFKYG